LTEPAALARIAEQKRITVDVRAALRAGEEPFARIMAARRDVPAGGALSVRAIFEPVPLYAVMRAQGFAHWTEELGPEDWRVWFYPDDGDGKDAQAPPPRAQAAAATAPGGVPTRAAEANDADDSGVVVLDVRGLEPPEPMVRTLAALEALPPDGTLVQLNVRVPQFLLPMLEERGFTYEVREQAPDLVRVFIRHGSGPTGR
jgi:uncharacterized protein (DUF2249 family)